MAAHFAICWKARYAHTHDKFSLFHKFATAYSFPNQILEVQRIICRKISA